MNVGYAQVMITPSLERPVYLAGFGQNRRAGSVHDDLYARALSIQTASTTLVLCALDLIGFFRPDVLEVTRRVRQRHPGVEMVIASTHTHHGPDTMGMWGPDEKTRGVDELYQAEIKQKIFEVCCASLEQAKPARIKAASVQVKGVAKNYRNPEIVDDELTLLQFVGEGDAPLATLFNFPCHPEVLWNGNPHISSDYPGVLRAEVESQTGAPCLFFAGALGGMMSPDVKDHSFAEMEAMGKKLAIEGLTALASVPAADLPALQVTRRPVAAKLTNPLYKFAFWRKLLPDVRNRYGQVETEVTLIKFGSAWLATVPGEMLPKLGLRLKDSLRAAGASTAGVIGLANDELGYILPEEDFKYPWNPFRPGKHYEETNSISKEIGPKVMGALEGLIGKR
ncbi:MAG: neutral/alkaline non-lysosomal ceramidase N-terminal domain-containing protein [Anaerolineae bacterium]|nr:neutral/alkaline non-lysosomal ceramidase N-terminal domain-containing protein [Anaerolineae bacterium]